MLQRHVMYLGKINSSQEFAWRRSIEVLDEGTRAPRTLALFADTDPVKLRQFYLQLVEVEAAFNTLQPLVVSLSNP